jgi:hypothetical protein
MRKSLAFILLAATSFLVGGGLCFAAESSTPEGAAAPAAVTPQPSLREMHRTQQSNIEEQKDDSEEDQTNEDQPNEEAPVQTQSIAAPAPSQRTMQQQMREARRNQAIGNDNR